MHNTIAKARQVSNGGLDRPFPQGYKAHLVMPFGICRNIVRHLLTTNLTENVHCTTTYACNLLCHNHLQKMFKIAVFALKPVLV